MEEILGKVCTTPASAGMAGHAGGNGITWRIRRMRTDPNGHPSRRNLAELVQVYLDAAEPDGKH